MARYLLVGIIGLLAAAAYADERLVQLEANARESQRVVRFARGYCSGWLAHADPRSGLLPQSVATGPFWNAKDSAADNYPFMVITALLTDDFYLKQTTRQILATEQKLCNRLDRLPDDFLFAMQKFRSEQPKLDDIIFGAAEYAKDGLIPITEWHGPSPWRTRMEELVGDIFKHAPVDSPVGKRPTRNIEVMGDLLQVTSRLYWMTGDGRYKEYAFRLADYYLLHDPPTKWDHLRLVDHGCEVIGGLTEACVIAEQEDAQRWQQYRPAIRAILDLVLEIGVNPDGMLYGGINPSKREVAHRDLSDTWGYVYDGVLTIAAIDQEPRYREAAAKALSNLDKYKGDSWGDKSADGRADSIEGALNLLNRLPGEAGFRWVEREMDALLKLQRDDGLIEGWHGDGNCTRTAWMYALWKTQGIAAAPWREDLRLGAMPTSDGGVEVYLACDWPWTGSLRFDRLRHYDVSYMPFDYPRINQWPEWFTVRATRLYDVTVGEQPAIQVSGAALLSYPLSVKPKEPLRLIIKPVAQDPAKLRAMAYKHGPHEAAMAWQKELRGKLTALLYIDDLLLNRPPVNPASLSEKQEQGYVLREVELNSTSGRRIKALVGTPPGAGPFPAVVCIHGHGGSRQIVYDAGSVYRSFAHHLAQAGFVTIACDVGQHEVYEAGRTLLGERLWDLMRCLDYLKTLPEVDASRIGCAGLSLGGEMAMWLAAIDERIAATVSSGFLTCMDQMESGHCMCWKMDGLRELADFPDIYGLIAPRPLQCQNGLGESPEGFIPPLARRAMKEIDRIYADMGVAGRTDLDVHSEGHVIDLPALVGFLQTHLGNGDRHSK